MITKEILMKVAKKKGLLNKEYIEKDYFQDLLLFNIYKQTNLLIFKGGTALYKLYDLQRFSEDLDFTLIGDLDIEKTIKNVVFEKFDVKNYISSYTDINPFNLRILNSKEMIAEKIHSLLNRESARDLYDLFFLLKFADIDKSLIEKKLNVFDMKLNNNILKKRISNLGTLWKKELNSFVLHELPEFNVVSKFVFEKLKR